MSDIYAEDVNYWKTSSSSADSWIEKAKKEIKSVGGAVLGEAYASSDGKAAFMLAFTLDGDSFKVTWPVLQSKTGNQGAAKVQAATALYHDVKARCVSLRFLGSRAAFMSYLLLPDGRAAGEAGSAELVRALPLMLGCGDER